MTNPEILVTSKAEHELVFFRCSSSAKSSRTFTYFLLTYVKVRIIMYLKIRKGDTKDANDIHRDD